MSLHYKLAICFILLAVSATAQRVDFTHLSVENGLPQKSVLDIAQDSRGFLWFGTGNGLCRYDSRTFKTYHENGASNSLSAGYILSLLADGEQNLWVGTSNGLDIYQPQTDDFEHVPLSTKLHASQIVNCIAQDKANRIWVGTTTGLYLLANTGRHEVLAFYQSSRGGLNGNNIHAITKDAVGTLWVGTDKGLTAFTPKGSNFILQTFRHVAGEATSLADDNVASIAEDANHKLWIGLHEKGLDSFDAATRSFVHHPDPEDSGNGMDNIRKIVVKNNVLWLGTQDGLSTFDIATQKFYTYKHRADDPKSLNQNSIYSLFFDKDETLWIGTFFGGVNIATVPVFTVYQTNNSGTGISNNVVSSVLEDYRHNLWIGTEGGGLNYINQADKRITVYQHQKNNPSGISSSLIKTVYRDKDGNIWIGTHGGGLNVLKPGQSYFTKYLYNENDAAISTSEVRAVTEDDKGVFWVGTNTGLKLFKRNGTSLTPLNDKITASLKSQAVNCLYKDTKGALWIGGWGLFKLDAKGVTIQPIYPAKLNARVNCINQDTSGNIWVGTDTYGLFEYITATQKLYKYTENEGLSNNSVYGIVQDRRGNMWISTGNGLSELNVKTGIFHNYTAGDGLAGNEFNKNSFAKLADGEMIFGGFNGFTRFFPDNFRESHTQPTAYITGLKLFNQPVAVDDSTGILQQDISLSKTISFKYTQNVFTIDFVILNYIRSEKNKYAYRIQSIDNGWNYTSLPTATYNNLPPGQYLFLAKGQNNDGVWSNVASVTIIVQPPWWRTWLAYVLYAAVIGAIIFLILRYFFLQALLKRDQELTALKLNFFTNISHEIRTYLTLISAPVEKLLMVHNTNDDDTRQLQTIKKNSDELLHLVNELMDFRKAETGNLTLHVSRFNIAPFVQSICQSFQELAIEKNINTELNLSKTKIEVWFDKEQMRKVLFNLLSNAYKFTPAGGTVNISLIDDEDSVMIKVADNGIGISPENIDKLFNNYFQENDYGQQNTGYGIGLALSKSIVALHHGELSVESHNPATDADLTTTFTIKLKKGDAHFERSQMLNDGFDEAGEFESEQEEARAKTNITTAPVTQKPYTLLVVEDNPEVRRFITEAFSGTYRILEAGNGSIGFDVAAEHIPDLIISDVMMPEMDGYSLCDKIKTDSRTDHIPVILLTAKASVPNQISGLEKGADVYLTKPFSIQVLMLQVQNLISSAEKLRKRYGGLLASMPVDEDDQVENEFIKKIIVLTEEQMANPDFDVEMICRHMAMSQTVLYKKIKALTDMTLNDIVKEVRFKKAAQLISTQKYTVYEVADMVGYNDTKYFSREFKKQFGLSPRDYKLKN
jgi:ligand-binding sensor domain-containing protein/signal transduction histidine kinase/DNA-binding response OmpR family regulator